MVGLQGREKKFDDIFSSLDTVPASDGHPASQPSFDSKDVLCIYALHSKKQLIMI